MKQKVILYVIDGYDEQNECVAIAYTTSKKERDEIVKEMKGDGYRAEMSAYGFSREEVETALYEKIFGELRG